MNNQDLESRIAVLENLVVYQSERIEALEKDSKTIIDSLSKVSSASSKMFGKFLDLNITGLTAVRNRFGGNA
tara:strand:- start:2611 stop:2826 length:216 start_codon:yes stop_codon:yes gene_type:complete